MMEIEILKLKISKSMKLIMRKIAKKKQLHQAFSGKTKLKIKLQALKQ